ncbi:LOW QUALITY PROTEIN: Ccc1 family, partial [Dillenia turbinata]
EFDVEVAVNYSKGAQWLGGTVQTDGLLSIASLMMGVGVVLKDVKTVAFIGITGLVGGTCSLAKLEFLSIYSQYDIELA